MAELAVRETVRNRLNADKIKLWLEPYTLNDGQRGEAVALLIENYSSALGLPKDLIDGVIEELRQHAVSKFTAMRKYKETGVATLRVRLTGNVPNDVDRQWSECEQPVEILLDSRGHDLKTRISELCGVKTIVLKPVANGRVIEDNISLNQQQISNFTAILVLCLSDVEVSVIEKEDHLSQIAKTRQAAELVAGYDGDDSNVYQLQIADQNGKILNIPKDEKKALGLAMMLHEKGRAAMKRKEMSLSLLFLLEADEEFKKCSSSILDRVDNYALLCLDIVWCYLRLQNVSALPDAESRLRTCEESFKKSYGPNLERLRLLKGGTGKEQALLMRLHLLQGVLAFHQAKNQLCRQKLQLAESELSTLQVDENSMTQVMAMGFTAMEARLGLRASGGNIDMALSHIMQQKEEKKKRLETEKAENEMKRLEKKLGKTANGDNVNVTFFKMIVSMGFSKGAAAAALRQTNNDISNALQVISDNPELLNLPDPDIDRIEVPDELIRQVVALGFDENSVRAALYHFRADPTRAVEQLMQYGGLALPEWYQSIPQSSNNSSSSPSNSASDSSISSGGSQADSNEGMSNEDRAKLIEEEIMPDIPQEEEEHLDLELDDETTVLEEYKARLASVL